MTMDAIMSHVVTKYDSHVMESMETLKFVLPVSPAIVTEMDGTVKKEEEITFGKAYDRHLMKVDKIKVEMKQVFSLVLGQADNDTKHCLEEHLDWKRVNQQKDLIKMLEILRNVNFQHKSTHCRFCQAQTSQAPVSTRIL